jgi:L-fuculose-phosphate aldolase
MAAIQDRAQTRGFGMDSPQWKIAAARRILFRNGLDSDVGGHVSMRAGDEDAFWANPVQYGDETLPEHVVKMGFDLKIRESGSFIDRSNAGFFHRDFYQARPDANCVIHTHGKWMTLLTTLGVPFDAYFIYGGLFLDEVGVFEDAADKPLAEEGDRMTAALGDGKILLWAHHGSVHVGSTLEQTVVEAIQFEICCERQIIATGVGGKPMKRGVAENYKRAIPGGPWHQDYWDAQVRRLRQSDPDLFEPRA